MSLNAKQSAFVVAYIGEAQWNATKAAKKAGYSAPRQAGSRLLSNPDIAAVIERNRLTVVSSTILTRSDAMEVLSGIARGEIGESTVQANLAGEVEGITEVPPKPADRIRAVAGLAKMQGWDRKAPIDGAEALRGKHPLEVVALLRAKASELEAQTLRQMGSGEDE